MIGVSKIRGSSAGAAEDYYPGRGSDRPAPSDRGEAALDYYGSGAAVDASLDQEATAPVMSGPGELVWRIIGDDRGCLAPAGIRDGEIATRESFRAALDGRLQVDGWSGPTSEAGAALLAQNVGDPDRVAALDVTFSPPKSVSALWSAAELAGDRDLADQIREINRDCAREALDGMLQMGAIEVRRGHGGRTQECPDFFAAACVDHVTSREVDPQLHVHAVVIASGFRHDEDGIRASALSSHALLDRRRAAMDLHHSLVADRLRGLGFCTERTKDAFEVAGVSTELMDALSTRRLDVMERARELGYEPGSVPHQLKERLMLQMRKPKETDDPAECLERWNDGYKTAGITPADVVASARQAGREMAQVRDLEPRQGADADLRMQIRSEALEALDMGHATFTEVEVQKAVFGACRARVSGEEHFRIAADMMSQDVLQVRRHDGSIARDERGRALYTTPELMRAEKRLLANAIDRQGERDFISDPAAAIDAAVDASRERGITLTDEQVQALQVAASRDGVSVVEGSAGAGKSTVMRCVNEIYATQGYRVIGAAPSWKASLGLRESAGIAECQASQGLALRLADGRETIDDRTLLVIDEAGMISTKQLDTILHHARLAGAKVMLTGDTRQLAAVDAGSPMEALIRHLPAQSVCRIAQVRRQAIDWQREATQQMSAGKMSGAIDAYFENGRILLHDSGADARRAVVEDCRAALGAGKAFLALTVRNADARVLNEALRPLYREAGQVTGQDITVVLRHRDGIARETPLAEGDRLLMGERVTVTRDADGQETHLNTSQVVSVIAVETRPDGTRLTLDADGQMVTGRLEDMVGYRAARDVADRVPRMQHAYAMTVYSSQGETISTGAGLKDGVVSVLNSGGFRSATTLVAMSRHTEDVRMHVDAGRVHEELLDRQVSDGRNPSQVTVSPGDIRRAVINEMERPSSNANIIDAHGHGHLDSFLTATRLRSGLDYAHAPHGDRLDDRRQMHLDALKQIPEIRMEPKAFERTIKSLERAYERSLALEAPAR